MYRKKYTEYKTFRIIKLHFLLLLQIYGGRIIPYEDEFAQNDMRKCIVLYFGSDKNIAHRFYLEYNLPIYAYNLIGQTIEKGCMDEKLLCKNIVTF